MSAMFLDADFQFKIDNLSASVFNKLPQKVFNTQFVMTCPQGFQLPLTNSVSATVYSNLHQHSKVKVHNIAQHSNEKRDDVVRP